MYFVSFEKTQAFMKRSKNQGRPSPVFQKKLKDRGLRANWAGGWLCKQRHRWLHRVIDHVEGSRARVIHSKEV
jgi:hypothetical protein